MDFTLFVRRAERELADLASAKERRTRDEAERKAADLRARPSTAPSAAVARREAPPYLVYAAAEPVKRSASHTQFAPPPKHLRPPRPFTPQPTRTIHQEDTPLPMTSHKSHFAETSYVPRQLPSCRPPTNPAPYSNVVATLHAGLPRTTSADAFQATAFYGKRSMCKPPAARQPPFSSADARGVRMGTTHADAFKFVVRPARREACRPPTSSRMPFSSADALGTALPRTTSSEHFMWKAQRRRQPCRPTHVNAPPYGDGLWSRKVAD